MDAQKQIIDRSIYDIYSAFPQIASFPVYDRPNRRVAVLVRLFSYGDDQGSAKYVRTALWSMRSHMLNSDMRDYQPTVVFHVESAFATARDILTAAGVPQENIIIYPTGLLKPQRRGHALHKAIAPLVDTQLDEFERVIVLDADSFSLSNEASGVVPLMDMSLNEMPTGEIALLRGWETYDPSDATYINWYDFVGSDEKFYRKAASYCDTTPAVIKRLCFPDTPLQTPHPAHNGAYINFETGLLRGNSKLREFIHDVSADMGNEEIAFAVWAMKRHIETGKYFPTATVEAYARSHASFHLQWELSNARQSVRNEIPALLHLYGYHDITNYAFDFANEVHASAEEAHMFQDTVTAGIHAALSKRARTPQCL